MSEVHAKAVSFPALRNPELPVHKIADRLEPYLRNLVEKVHPEKVLLFGSQATGSPSKHSDVDLLVVSRGQQTMLEGNLAVRRAFRGVAAEPLSFSIVSVTPEQFQAKLANHDAFFAEIARTGIELYAA